MEIYILKSGLCLAVFYGFYKLLLEKESFHNFKRFYLIASLVLAFVIPLITFTEYREIIPQEAPLFSTEIPQNTITKTTLAAYLPIVLWSIYGLGVFLFGFKFLKNLLELVIKIKRNPKFKNESLINVLLQDLVIPHTFFSYIFLNKQKFESHQIPIEVLLHEETHAKQKHSIDVVFIEIFQILFWFNPFIYLIKRSIKLNHEFLADQSVLNKGVIPSKYQQILLAFSSNASETQLANAINYSSIKKRFTIMKTQTSKQSLWIKSFILLPLLVILTFSFSNKQIVTHQQKATLIEITEYNQLAKKYNLMSESNEFIVKKEEKERLNYLYNKMSVTQRKTAELFPVFPPPPPAPTAPRVVQGDVMDLPPPPPPFPHEPNNPSKGLLEAKKNYDEKVKTYAEAMQIYFKEKKGNLHDLRKMYDDTMILYNKYSDLAKKELELSKD
ncbi:M56 family metallopeptidase [Gaetbulibacter aquiaggeris]|uniref:M56 family metallopeptidase n=1 Tax=Gaetbulibacter aquiaggeris TaxID=1735373 RepID=A0ABW7MLU1_9FLAO